MKMIIELSDKIKNFNEYIEVKQMNGDMVEGIYKMPLSDLLNALHNATDSAEEDNIETPILPLHCIKHVWKDRKLGIQEVYIEVPKQRWDITYFDKPMKQVGFPRLIFKYRIEVTQCKIATIVAVKDNGRIKGDTQIYHFPFSHVSTSGNVCMGGNTFPTVTSIQQIQGFHSLFISSPFTNDYGVKTLTGKELRQIFNELQENDFDDEWLLPIKPHLTFNGHFGFEQNN